MASISVRGTMGRKKKKADEEGAKSPFVTVKIGRPEHAKLRIIAAHQDRDISEVLTELARGPIDRLWKQAVKEQGEKVSEEGEAK